MASTVATTPMMPTGRDVIVDVVRGFALGGVLLVNMQRYVEDFGGPLNALADAFIAAFARGKFYPLFALLFGFGFAQQLARARTSGLSIGPLYLRRLAVLLCFGIGLYVLLERNDILIAYATLGVPLLWLRGVRTGTLLIVTCLVLACAIAAPGVAASIEARRASLRHELEMERNRARDVYQNGTYSELIQLRVGILASHSQRPSSYAPWFHYFGMFLVGLYAHRKGLPRHAVSHRTWWAWCGAALTVGGLLGVLAVFGHRVLPADLWSANIAAAVTVVSGTMLAIAYGGCLIGQWQHRPVARWLAVLASAGRMSLTNFVLHYIVMTAIFHPYGLGLYKRVGSAVSIVLACAIFGAQLAASRWWFGRFAYGPLEWLWRALSYWSLPRLRV